MPNGTTARSAGSKQQQDRDAREGDELIDAAAAAKPNPPLTNEEVVDATDWLLSTDPEDTAPATDVIDLNVGSVAKPRWVRWEIQAVDEAVIRRILRASAPPAEGNRRQRRAGGAAGADSGIDSNLQIVVAGTISPDLEAVAAKKMFPQPSMVVQLSFKRKPGLIGQIADRIMSLSGFDDEDVRESREVAAAGN